MARNTIANLRRSGHRQARLAAELERFRQVAEPAAAADVLATERATVLAGLAALTPKEREALLLVAWDGLTPEQAAKVAGCTLPAFHVRLFRARRRLHADGEAEARPHDRTRRLRAGGEPDAAAHGDAAPRPLTSPGGTA